ncbi:MAG: sigma-70 family RNA polymerase sigma factor [Propionibacteriales bacterium]|nr:sigma-70 family RNA polymerase sigma factor [Propionibacteriales bacterium]
MRETPDRDVARISRDPEVFEAFYRRHVDEVQRFIARRVADPYLAADLAAEVFLAAIESAHKYRPGRGAPVAWLYGIARNVLAAHRRRRAREVRVAVEVSGRALVDDDDLVRLEERIDAARQARHLYVAMDRLSESERAVLELVALDGLTAAEAAKVLRISPVAARVRLHRARGAMQRALAPPVNHGELDLSEVRS